MNVQVEVQERTLQLLVAAPGRADIHIAGRRSEDVLVRRHLRARGEDPEGRSQQCQRHHDDHFPHGSTFRQRVGTWVVSQCLFGDNGTFVQVGSFALLESAQVRPRPILIGTWASAEWAIRFYERNGFELASEEQKTELLKTDWDIPDRQIETSVVLAQSRLRATPGSVPAMEAAAVASEPVTARLLAVLGKSGLLRNINDRAPARDPSVNGRGPGALYRLPSWRRGLSEGRRPVRRSRGLSRSLAGSGPAPETARGSPQPRAVGGPRGEVASFWRPGALDSDTGLRPASTACAASASHTGPRVARLHSDAPARMDAVIVRVAEMFTECPGRFGRPQVAHHASTAACAARYADALTAKPGSNELPWRQKVLHLGAFCADWSRLNEAVPDGVPGESHAVSQPELF